MKFGFSDPEACINWLLSSPLTQEQIEILSSSLTVGETYFFRDKIIYESLEKHVLSELVNTRRKHGKYLRIWSAGCSSGEEPYSVAILLYKMLPDITEWNISIIATDINQSGLEKAHIGIYREWSFRGTPEWIKDGYFIKNQVDSYAIMPSIKNMVSFSYHNLAKDPFPSLINNTTAIDIILCRNVIMYFHPELVRRIISLFYRSLLNGGWLIVSGSEGYMVHGSRFVTISFPDTIFFRKDMSKSGKMENYPVNDAVSIYKETFFNDPGVFPEVNFNLPSNPLSGSLEAVALNKEEEPETSETNAVREADTLYNQGNYMNAENILTKYLLNDKENSEAMSLLVKIFSNRGKFGKAIELCRKGIETDKCNPAFHYLLALIYQEQGRMDEAVSSLQSSIYLDNDHVLSYYTMGNILFQQGDMKKAGKCFKNALSILNSYDREIILSGSDGISAGRLTEIIKMRNLSDNRNI
jgi:chemotaxis protein methyltransferase CheR